MKYKFSNNVSTTLYEELSANASEMRVYKLSTGLHWPVLNTTDGQEVFACTLVDPSTRVWEIVYVKEVIEGTIFDTLKITRGEEETGPAFFSKNSRVEVRITAAALNTYGEAANVPLATTTRPGLVSVGKGLNIDSYGKLSSDVDSLPIATAEVAGIVKAGPDMTIDEDGTLNFEKLATKTNTGLIKVGNGLFVQSDGTLQVDAGAVVTRASFVEEVLVAEQDLTAPFEMELPTGFDYASGSNLLEVSVNGTVWYNGKQYQEVCEEDSELCTKINFLGDIPKDSEIRFRVLNGTAIKGEPGNPAPQIDDTQASTEHPWSGAKVFSELPSIATSTEVGLVKPDGVTTVVDSTGLLSVLGGNLQWNTEEWITESGNYTILCDGYYFIELYPGGDGAYWIKANKWGTGGQSFAPTQILHYYNAGTVVPVVIGVGGISMVWGSVGDNSVWGSVTKFGDYVSDKDKTRYNNKLLGAGVSGPSITGVWLSSSGAGGAYGIGGNEPVGPFAYGSGGALIYLSDNQINTADAKQGAIRLLYYDPAKANGPVAASTFAKSRKAAHEAQSAAVNLYDPETGQGSVWREEDAPVKLAEGLITQEAWQAICEQKAAEAHAAWLTDPDTEMERFALLRSTRDIKLATTDYLVVLDYPLTSEQRLMVTTYRQALRDLPSQEGAPWDGGGELTPWPEEPNFIKKS